MLGAFFEIGPCTISEDGKTTSMNPYSWTKHANMLFIEYVLIPHRIRLCESHS